MQPAGGKSRQKVLVVEDDLSILMGLSMNLRYEGYEVLQAQDGEKGLQMAIDQQPDVVVLDVMLPGLDGLAVLRDLRRSKQTPVIMLTARDRIEDRVRGLQEGADDYLVKPFSFLELVARLQALTRRGRTQEPTQFRLANLHVDLLARKAWRGSTRIDLTAKEFALLATLARHEGEILSKTAIAEMVWDMNFDSHTNVVEVAIKRLRAKIDGGFSPKLLHTMRGMGYVLEARDEAEAEPE